MATLILNEIVTNASSNSEGEKLFMALSSMYKKGERVELVVDNNASMSSSFLNSSIGMFLEEHGLNAFKHTFKFRGSQNQFSRLSNYIKRFSETHL